MRLLKLHLENFLSFTAKQTLKLSKRGIVLLEGENKDDASARSNGSGKSATFDALVWCLYGRTTRGLKGDEVVNRFVGKDCWVMLQITDGTNNYAITRYRKHAKFKNGLELCHESARLTGVSVEETQQKINDLIGYDFTSFTGVLCGQGVMEPFSSLTDADAKKIMENVVGIRLYTDAAKLAGEKLFALENKMIAVKDRIEHEEQLLERHRASVVDLKARLAEVGVEKKKREKQAREDILAVNGEIDDLTKKLATVDKATKAVLALETQWEEATEAYEATKDAFSKASVVLETADTELLEQESHVGKVGTVCSSCGSKIDGVNLKRLVDETRERRQRARKKWDQAGAACQPAAMRVDDLNAEIKKARGQAQGDGKLLKSQISTRRSDLEKAERRLEECSTLDRDVRDLLAKARESRERAKEALAKQQAALDDMKPEYKALEFWAKGFGNKGLKSLVLDSQLPFLNKKARRYSQILTDGNLEVSFRTQDTLKSGESTDRFGVDVENRNGGESYFANSRGERAKVDLVVGLAFQALMAARSGGLNVVFLDEVFEGLDSEGLERVVTILTEEMDDRESVFVITHREELRDNFSHSVRVIKEGRASRIED